MLIHVEEAEELADPDQEHGVKLEPFNLAQERAEGHFDESGHYVENKPDDANETDAWLGSEDGEWYLGSFSALLSGGPHLTPEKHNSTAKLRRHSIAGHFRQSACRQSPTLFSIPHFIGKLLFQLTFGKPDILVHVRRPPTLCISYVVPDMQSCLLLIPDCRQAILAEFCKCLQLLL